MSEPICANCGRRVEAGLRGVVIGDRCPHCRLPRQSPVIEAELAMATEGWTSPVIVRTYPSDKAGRLERGAEAELLGHHGYVPSAQVEESPGLANSGRVFLARVLSVLAIAPLPLAPLHSISVTYSKEAQAQDQ